MKTQNASRLTCLIAVIITLVSTPSCQKTVTDPTAAAGKSAVSVYLTDDPSLVFEKVWLDIRSVEVKVEDSGEAEAERGHESEADDNDRHGITAGGWMSITIHPGVYDILRFRNGLDTLFTSGTFSANRQLKKIRVTLGQNNSVVFNGIQRPLTVKNNDNIIVMQIDESAVQVNSGGMTNIWLDIDAGNSIRKVGNAFELKPSVKVFSRDKAGTIEGSMLPAGALAVVMAVNGSDTATAKPASEGEFKFIGLKKGTYTLVYHATANGYLDQTVPGIQVGLKEDVHIPTIVLHP